MSPDCWRGSSCRWKSRAVAAPLSGPRLLSPHGFGVHQQYRMNVVKLHPGLAGGLFQRAQQSDLQRAMDVYQQEFNRLQQNALAAAFRAQQNGAGTKLDQDEGRHKTETPNPPESPATSTGDTKSPGARQESPLGNDGVYFN